MINQSYMNKSLTKITLNIISAVFGSVYFGYALAYYGITQNSIVYILGYQDSSYKSLLDGIINAVLPVGAALGAFYSELICKKFGFRLSFILTDIIGILNVVLSLYLNFSILIITRFIYGILVGINSALNPQYIYQISPQNLNGLYGVLCNVGLLLGLTLAFILSWVCLQLDVKSYDSNLEYGILGFNKWRIMFGFPAITCFLRLMAFLIFFRKRLAVEYVNQGEIDKAKMVLNQTFFEEYQDEIMTNLISISKKSAQEEQSSFDDLLNPIYKKRLLIGCKLSLLNQWCGINAINFYSVTVFNYVANENLNIINLLTVLDGLISLILCLLSGFGRRLIFLIGNGVGALSLTMVAAFIFYLNSLENNINDHQNKKIIQITILIFVFSFIIAFSMSLGPVFWIYIADILPPKGISIVVLLNWLSLALLTQVFPIVAEQTNVAFCFGAFAIFSVFGQIFIYKEVKETKQVMKEQINELFSSQENKKVYETE